MSNTTNTNNTPSTELSKYGIDNEVWVFEPEATQYCLANACHFVKASALAYEPEALIKQVVTQWGFDRFQFLNADSTQGFVCGNATVVWVVFRGTDPTQWNDIETDLKLGLVENSLGGMTHEGFTEGVDVVWSQIEDALSSFRDHAQPIWFSGHSLGGALAPLAAARLHVDGKLTAQGVYTYGEPRVGNYTFTEQYNKVFGTRTFRFINHQDIVPRVPPAGLILRYWHSKAEVYIDSKGQIRRKIPFWSRLEDEFRGAVKHHFGFGIEVLEDHKLIGYESAIQEARN